jgi:hypothetical protein
MNFFPREKFLATAEKKNPARENRFLTAGAVFCTFAVRGFVNVSVKNPNIKKSSTRDFRLSPQKNFCGPCRWNIRSRGRHKKGRERVHKSIPAVYSVYPKAWKSACIYPCPSVFP